MHPKQVMKHLSVNLVKSNLSKKYHEKDRKRNPSEIKYMKTLYIVSASVCSIKGRHIHPVRHAKHPKQILQTKHTFTTKLRGRPFDSAGEGGSGSLC